MSICTNVDRAQPASDRSGAGRLLLARALLLTALALPAAACTAGGAAPATPAATPDPRFALVKILATQTHLVGADVTVVGQLQNGDSAAHDITLRADFTDPAGAALGSAQGVAEDVVAGATADFQIHAQVDPARYGTTQVTVISLGEQK